MSKLFCNTRRAFSLASPAFAALLAAAPANALGEVVITETFSPGLNVPDLGFVTDARALGAGLSDISSVSVSLNLGVRGAGGFNGELIATLLHGGQTAALLNQAGRNNDSLAGQFGYADSGGFDVTFSDSAAHDIHTYQNQLTPVSGSPVTGTWQPDGRLGASADASTPRNAMLGVFNGQSSSGDWTLVVEDTGFGDTLHRLNSWSLKVAGTPGANPVTLRDSSSVVAGGSGETFHGLVTVGGSSSFSGGLVRLDGGLSLESSSELHVDGSVRIGGTISDSGAPRGITKTGAGTLAIEGAATHTDRTVVREGALIVDGSITSSTTTVEAGGVIGGSGSVARLELRGGVISPGHSPGTLTSGSQLWDANSTLLWEINDAGGAAGGNNGWDFLQINGNLEIAAGPAGKFEISVVTLDSLNVPGLLAGFDPGQSYAWNLAQVTGAISGFSPDVFLVNTDGFDNAFDGSFSIASNGGFLTLRYTPVPEPAETAAIIAALLGAFAAFRRKSIKAS